MSFKVGLIGKFWSIQIFFSDFSVVVCYSVLTLWDSVFLFWILSKSLGRMKTYESSCSEPASKSCNTIAKEWGQININTTIVHLT